MSARALARNTDPATSKEAAAQVSRHITNLEFAVLTAMRLLDRPATSREIAVRAGLELLTVSPRLRPLVRKGFVGEAGVRDGCTLWTLAPKDEPAPPGES